MRALLLFVGLVLVCAGCGGGGDQPGVDAPGQTLALPSEVDWPEVDGAVEYRVQAWSGMRLLFEEPVAQPPLRVTPAMQRSLLGSSGVELQVRAFAADGEQVGEVWRQTHGQTHTESNP